MTCAICAVEVVSGNVIFLCHLCRGLAHGKMICAINAVTPGMICAVCAVMVVSGKVICAVCAVEFVPGKLSCAICAVELVASIGKMIYAICAANVHLERGFVPSVPV